MQSSAKDVASYIREASQERQKCLTRLRKLCLDTLAGFEEGMDYRMPCYKREGVVEVAFASQKNHISLYVNIEGVVKANRELLKGLNVGKGCIRYTRPEQIDFSVVQKLLSETLESQEDSC
jgi:uncharacterized protein YdhG (YjbR/CyaY superfamily)